MFVNKAHQKPQNLALQLILVARLSQIESFEVWFYIYKPEFLLLLSYVWIVFISC